MVVYFLGICPPDKPYVNCFVDPCDFTICPAYPDATCIPDYCGGCNKRFELKSGKDVTHRCFLKGVVCFIFNIYMNLYSYVQHSL